MSVKAQALVWDLECPAEINGVQFKPGHKFCLVAYSDHADHNGRNIYPAVPTVARKMGVEDRTVQRLTRDLEAMGLLVADGVGPRGTNKWYLPYSQGGDKLSPVTISGGDKNGEPLGDIPSGDIPSGDILSPELKEPEPKDKYITRLGILLSDPKTWQKVKRKLEADEVQIVGTENKMHITGLGKEAEAYAARFTRYYANLGVALTFEE